MSGMSFNLGSKRSVSQTAAKPKKPVTVNDLFSADSDDEAEQQPQKQPQKQPQQSLKRKRWDDAAGVGVTPPNDPEVKRAADKLAEFVAKNGRSFEEVTRSRNPGESHFKFLFDKTCSDYLYYESKIQESMAGPQYTGAPAQPALAPSQPGPLVSRRAFHTHCSSTPSTSAMQHSEPEKVVAKHALQAGDSLAAMNAYMKLAAKKDKPTEEEERRIPHLNDTAFERRKVAAVFKQDGSRGHHMQDFIPPEELATFLAKCGDKEAAEQAEAMKQKNAIQADNIGHKLLQKMGWREGEGIGAAHQGITVPVAANGVKQDNLGLGAGTVTDVAEGDDIFEQYRKRMMLGYKHRPNPLGNPRKAYY